MTASTSTFTLDPYSQARVDLWHAASLELSIGPEADDPFVQAGVHAILEWLRGEVATATELVDTLAGRTAHSAQTFVSRAACCTTRPRRRRLSHPRLWWWVVKAAYYRRWLELTRPPVKNASDHAG
jgi:hypothetical protein